MKILLTGGAGYIGSHTYLSLVEAGYDPVIVDNFDNSSPAVLDRLGQLTQRKPVFYEADVRDAGALETILRHENCEAVIHFAGLKSVGESMAEPLRYFEVNVGGTERLLHAMQKAGCKKLIFSSSAFVYGIPEYLPVDEDHPLVPHSVYGNTKRVAEDMMRALFAADPDWSIALLRYFNPIGAHPSSRIGEEPSGIPNNLMPYITQVAVGRREHLSVFGDDYETPDGTGIRDYIHVCDLAEGHVAALQLLKTPRCTPLNLGIGRGYSVLDVVKAFEEASGRHIPCKITGRRAGDIAQSYADPTRAREMLNWQARFDLSAMCADAWNWQSHNPNGYDAADDGSGAL